MFAAQKTERRRQSDERKLAASRERGGPKLRERTLRQRYGIGIAEWEQMFAKQNGACAICEASNKRLVVDHCHHSKRVRGLLCDGCNQLMGMLDGKTHLIHRAIIHQVGTHQ